MASCLVVSSGQLGNASLLLKAQMQLVLPKRLLIASLKEVILDGVHPCTVYCFAGYTAITNRWIINK